MSFAQQFQATQLITVRAFKADGNYYRWWQVPVETVSHQQLTTWGQTGDWVHEVHRPNWQLKHHMRSYYQLDKPYNVIEVYEPAGELHQLYININTPPIIKNGEIHFVDHELDISKKPPHTPARIIDEDEFAEAIQIYGYTPDFQKWCYDVAHQAVKVANNWQARGL